MMISQTCLDYSPLPKLGAIFATFSGWRYKKIYASEANGVVAK
jgi:hypothetical protein